MGFALFYCIFFFLLSNYHLPAINEVLLLRKETYTQTSSLNKEMNITNHGYKNSRFLRSCFSEDGDISLISARNSHWLSYYCKASFLNLGFGLKTQQKAAFNIFVFC